MSEAKSETDIEVEAEAGRDVDAPRAEGADTGTPEKRRRRRGRRIGLFAFIVVLCLALMVGAAALVLVGRPLIAPDWLKARIEDQINERSVGAKIAFDELSLVIEDGWAPRVHLRDVDVADAEGRHLLRLADVNSTLALRPLLNGTVQPARIWLSGAQLVLQRDLDGNVDLSFGEAAFAAQEAASFVQLIEQADAALVTPTLSDLKLMEADALTIRYEDARAGRGWTVDGGRVTLSREDDILTLRGDFALLSGGDEAATIEMSYQSRIGSAAAAFGMNFRDVAAQDIAVQSAALLWLDVLRAPISGALRASTDEAGNFGPLSATLQIGEGVLQPTEETKPVPFKSAKSYFTYDPADQTMRFDEMSFDSAWGQLQADGQVKIGTIEGGLPEDFVGQMRVARISMNPDGLYAEPVQLTDVTVASRLVLDPFTFTLGEMTLRDGDSRLRLGGALRAGEAGWDLSLQGRLNQLTPARLLELWPESVKPRTREWIERNIMAGQMRNLQLGLRALPEAKPEVFLGFEFDGLETLFMKTMPPVRGGRGHATLDRNVFTVTAEAGKVRAEQGGAVDITGTVFRIPDVTVREGPGEVDLVARGTITSGLSLLDREPFRFITKAGQPVTLADGRAETRAHIDFLLKKKLPADKVSFTALSSLRDVRSEKLVPGRVLAAQALEVSADNTSLRIAGEGRIGQVPADVVFSAPLGKDSGGRSRVEGTIELSERFVDEFNLGLPRGSVSGSGQGQIEIALQRGAQPSFTLSSNLAGLALSIPQIGWSIGRDARGALEVAGKLGEPFEVSRIALDAPGLRANGRLVLTPEGAFREARFARVRAGNWLDVPVTLVSRGAGRAPEVRVEGGTVDLSQTEIGGGEGSGGGSGGGPLIVSLERLRISDSIALTGFRGEFSTAKGMDGSFIGKVNGGAPVTGRVLPRNGRSAFRILSKNAGGVFRSAGLLENAHGGEMDLTLLPGGGPGSFDGRLEAKNVWLRGAPAMAELLNAMSIVGLLEQLSGRGILFGEIEARFRLNPSQVIVTRSSAVGTSMGISMDGYYTFANSAMNFQGVLSPFYLVNGVGSILTRKGEGLIGFNYRLVGTPDRPRVRVNPLSLLTPGMFREIFRRPAPKVTQ